MYTCLFVFVLSLFILSYSDWFLCPSLLFVVVLLEKIIKHFLSSKIKKYIHTGLQSEICWKVFISVWSLKGSCASMREAEIRVYGNT